jgi:23S rRNA (cytidine1920-2'-O)/16S rRNA (cytidine1409-2'-O)-methyltransferase
MSKRLDQYLADEGYFESRARAKAAVMAGIVEVDGSRRVKPGTMVSGRERIDVDRQDEYVSRGGIKLEHALNAFGLDIRGVEALDVGSSTGGFTECMLRRGAGMVTALDVGRGQLHWKLRNDPTVVVREGVNARYILPGDIEGEPAFAAVDVSFISLRKVLEPVFSVLSADAVVIALVKPQFEAGRALVPRGGVVRDPGVRRDVLLGLRGWLTEKGLVMKGVCASPIKGAKGNVEYLVLVTRDGEPVGQEVIEGEVALSDAQ